jgi:hypothetical protein
MGTRSAWTDERRARQRELIRRWAPWRRSTGPKTRAGKARSAKNAIAFRRDPEMRQAYVLIEQFLRDGQMTPELGRILLRSELDTYFADSIYEDGLCNRIDEGGR